MCLFCNDWSILICRSIEEKRPWRSQKKIKMISSYNQLDKEIFLNSNLKKMIFIDKVLFFKLIDFVTLSVCQEGGGEVVTLPRGGGQLGGGVILPRFDENIIVALSKC